MAVDIKGSSSNKYFIQIQAQFSAIYPHYINSGTLSSGGGDVFRLCVYCSRGSKAFTDTVREEEQALTFRIRYK